uniref:Uncharacterized protein n=1 Tax=Siphoviridae sp. ctgBD49 TaxID=2826420 RepID=A0A8S5QQL9_9CAUD|nr:MAG TPA: hypothetical protein [Siphoviridae sp. ctgBD49]
MVQNGMPYQGMYPYYQSTQPTVQPMQQMPQMMTQNVPQQPVGVPGRIVHNPAEIRPNEVPMDGRKSYFPTDDEQYIFAKQWNSDGTIRTVKYEKCKDEPVVTQETTPDANSMILDRLDKIEKLLTAKRTSKKEEATE